jgi:protein required for attachment to host cells
VADESRARIFEESTAGSLHEIENFANPEGRAMNRDLNSDAQGRFHAKGGPGQPNSDAGEASPVEHSTDKFAKFLAERLDGARKQNQFRRIAIVAAPRFLGKLRNNVSREVEKLIGVSINKDLSQFEPRVIKKHLDEAQRPTA